MIKKNIKKIFNLFGLDIIKKKNFVQLDELLKKNLPKNPIIFDVGANNGETIEKYCKIFENPTIHSFEPNKNSYEKTKSKFFNKKNIFVNNLGLGEKKEEKEFNITAKSSNSSFININPNTKWLRKRSEQHNTSMKGYVVEKKMVQIDTLDHYVSENQIHKIDLLKIDTQGYEDKVLKGSLETIKKNKIGIILTEIMFDDVYDKYFSFSDLEQFLIPWDFRMVGIELSNNNLFTGLVFFADVMYFNKKIYKI